jgi:hypothetical protein
LLVGNNDGMNLSGCKWRACRAQADWAIVYYSGDGVEMNGINYLIPIRAEVDGHSRRWLGCDARRGIRGRAVDLRREIKSCQTGRLI